MEKDRREHADLLVRLGRWLDDKLFDDSSSVLAVDIEVSTPGGTAGGIEAVSAQARRLHTVATQHLFTNVLVDVEGDAGRIEAESFITMVEPAGLRTLGGRYAIATRRTAQGWRIRRIEVRASWDSAGVAGPR